MESICQHTKLKLDEFAQIPGVTRYMPGNACCATCGKALPYVKVGQKWEKVEKASDEAGTR